jgi:NADP-dependent 3-hydroxy acid dehydrogenase YdfG
VNILLLGASSVIGQALAATFSPNNAILLVGRNIDKLILAKEKCEKAGALEVELIEQDFFVGISNVVHAIDGWRIDLLIDVASASSQYRDIQIGPNDISQLLKADFSTRTEILNSLLQRQTEVPAVILISTVLALIDSPDRKIYSCLKSLYGIYLFKIERSIPKFRLLIVYVGTVIDPGRESSKANQLALAVHRAFRSNKRKLFFGISGRVLFALFHLQPILFRLVVIVQRKIRYLLT